MPLLFGTGLAPEKAGALPTSAEESGRGVPLTGTKTVDEEMFMQDGRYDGLDGGVMREDVHCLPLKLSARSPSPAMRLPAEMVP
ncbi:hypothetical protein LX36DRAFT_663871 [Colletotrichum falcatum]|nr:hypothetical protein LX36DRAFT_663871 [Colletotrichum falcatum]